MTEPALKDPKNHNPNELKGFNMDSISNLSYQHQQLFQKYGQGPVESPTHECIHHAIEKQATTRPNSIAVEHIRQTISYFELDDQANQFANVLQQHGIKRGDKVALFLKRSIPMVVAILACLKVGASYVPQHVGVAPKSQLSYILKVTQAKVIITLSDVQHLLPRAENCHCLCVDSLLAEFPDRNPSKVKNIQMRNNINQSDVCFILFTSGTTGVPNGVKVTHRNLCNILLTAPGNLGISAGMKVAQILNIAFDMAAWEIFTCLAHGGRLLIRDKDIQETASRSNIIIATPSILSKIDVEQCTDVLTVAVAGEPCPRPLAETWVDKCTFYNSCGPTETTIINTAQKYQKQSQLTIGAPTPNNSVYILDENLKPCPIGQVGEMWAGGDCVTAGYLNNIKLNNERYKLDPFINDGSYMFQTRDLGRWTNKGELEHHGRTDDQVKVRGFRVELDSVSTILESTSGCKKAVTVKLDDRGLVAFVSPANVDTKEALWIAANQLPYYCVPNRVIAIDNFPTTSRGKIDKRSLTSLALRQIELELNQKREYAC